MKSVPVSLYFVNEFMLLRNDYLFTCLCYVVESIQVLRKSVCIYTSCVVCKG